MLLKFDVCSPSITGDRCSQNGYFADFEQVKNDDQDGHLSAGQGWGSFHEFGHVKNDGHFADIGLVEIIGLVAARGQLNQMTQLHLLPLMVGKIWSHLKI